MTCPKQVVELIKRFEYNREVYTSGRYNETQLRHEFIDPFFIALGWDVNNEKGDAESYKDVIHEDAIKIGGATKAPDYCFRIGGTRKFFLEAKKPSVNLKDDIPAAFQLRRYAWSAKLSLSILTDFEEFAVYDCRVKPNKNDKASTARIKYLTYDEYPGKWDEIRSIFSPEAIRKGSFDKYAASKKKRGTAEVDDAFLKEIELWRVILAQNIALRNKGLSRRDINHAVQRTIDRIIFLRICEDRGIEQNNRLQGLLGAPRIYPRLVEFFYRADEKYNSGLFHFRKEKGRKERPDDLTPNLEIDDKVLKDIIKNLYYPDSPYEFSVLPADILGQVYEQFLGKVIRLTPGHQAKVEDKPEVKKAGGVYYTPTYIVDYIVKNTVGKLLEKKNPKQASKLRILDPACGSGSFLIGAYQYLLDYHLKWYSKHDPKKHAKGRNPKLYQAGFQSRGVHPRGNSGDWRLTTRERKRILLNNIYGVDIDTQAVEVTKLSLLLKVLEGENEQTLETQLKLLHERALPDLSSNIKCGNSLIGTDFYEGKQTSMFDDEERYRINPFDWHAEFPEIFSGKKRKNPGFDAVIGNPPYGAQLRLEGKKYLQVAYPNVSDYETAQFFISKSIHVTNRGGYVGFIVPNTMFLNVLAHKFRQLVATSFYIESLLDLSEQEVFQNATVRTVIPVLRKTPKTNAQVRFLGFEYDKTTTLLRGSVSQTRLRECKRPWTHQIANDATAQILDKMEIDTSPLNDILEISQGLIPYDKYRGHDQKTIKNRIWHANRKIDKTYKRELRGGDVKRYHVQWNGKQWISYGPWLAAPRKPEFFKEPRILFREITDPKTGLLHVAYTSREFYNNPSIINCISRGTDYSLPYLLGIANSRLIAYWHFMSSPKARKGVFPKILVNDVRNIPVHNVNFSAPVEKHLHDRMVELVELMLKLHKDLAKAKTEHDKTLLQRQIDATDRQIDKLVYELYGLTKREIKIVEEKEDE